ncbi:MAG: uroporphyrinogen decarboxylase family protein [Promethearchaeota archaeon]
MEKQWEELSSDERQEVLFQKWLSPPGIEFVSPQAEKLYKERATRIKDAIQMKKVPDRVPVFLIPSFAPAFLAGMTPQEVMYDFDKTNMAWKKFYMDLQPDAHGGAVVPGPGKFFEILDYKLYLWPGHGTAPEHTYQCVEGEYMKANEYDALIQDPSSYFTTVYLPRIFGALEPFMKLSPNIFGLGEIYGAAGSFVPYGLPDVQDAFKTLMEAGNEALKWAQYMGAFDKEITELGFPAYQAGATKAPFDILGDTLRGTKGIMLDMYRQPDKLLEALEVITPLMINIAVSTAKGAGNPLIFIPMHKGADGFLSDEQFKTFYWPTFKKVLMSLIDEGVVPFCWAEGGFDSRLEYIRDLPKGKTAWLFDLTDVGKAKKKIGNIACVGGNMPIHLISIGTPQDVKDHIKKCIDSASKGGGYIMANGAFFDRVKRENLKAMVDFTKEYGVYK